MSNTTFIVKYKPYYLDDFCVQDSFKKMIRLFLEIDDLNILINGSTSSGKTSMLYAIIREYYGLGRYQNIPENNIMFINSLKEQGINYFRNEMKCFCQSRCSIHGKKKMIVVDDVDMVNEQCQQVFRNYIDKYKNNVHFVFACSNLQKVIESIQSRIHILKLEPATSDQLRFILQKITEKEDIHLSNDAKEYLLVFSNHSIRQLINFLEKIHLMKITINSDVNKPIDLETCKSYCSTISFQLFETYIECIKKRELVKGINILYSMHDYGYSVIDIFDYLFFFIKITTLLTEDEKYKIIPFLCKYITFFYNLHENMIELALFTSDLIQNL